MDKKFGISIIMPVKNAGFYLGKCLDSILSQDFKDWELIAINDHSDDDSLEILKNYAKKDQRVKVLDNEKKGIIAALRLAFVNSNKEYIHRMDADDLMAPQKLSALYALLTNKGKGHIATGLVSYFNDQQPIGHGYLKYANWLNQLTSTESNYDEIYKECVIPSPCWLIHKEDLIKCGAFDSEVYPEDYDLCFRFYKYNMKVAGVTEVLHYWRDHQERSSRNDPNYSDHTFHQLKLHYFLAIEYDPKRPLCIWGAGKKGKQLAKQLQEKKIAFHWLSNNPKKMSVPIYGIQLEYFESIKRLNNPQIIVLVAKESEQIEIRTFLEEHNFRKKKHYFFFC